MTLLRKHALWLIITTLLGIAGAWLIYASRPGSYQSTAQVDVEPNVTVGTPVQPNMATEVQVATSGVVLASTARTLGITPQKLATYLSTNVTGTASVLTIGCTMPTPTEAQRCAAAVATAYIDFRNHTESPRSVRAHAPLHVTLVTPATLPAAPAGIGKRILLPLGALLGLALGLGEIFVRDKLDDRVRDRADLERCLDAPVLAAIPRVKRRMGDPALVFSRAPLSKAAEAYRYLRSRVKPLITSVADGGTVLLVTSAQAREGRTCIAANLATALAHAGADVIVVDADLRRPSLSEVFGADARPGLTDLLVGKAALEDVAVPTDTPGLRLVAVGNEGYQAADRFEVTRLTRAFAEMNAAADVVIVDSAPVLAVSDAITLARVSDLVMMVADVRSTGRAAVRAAVQEVRATGPRTIIGVLNNERSPGSSRARSGVAREPESLTHPPRAPTGLADVTPPSGPNGQLEAVLGTKSTRPHRPVDEADADGSGGSRQDSA